MVATGDAAMLASGLFAYRISRCPVCLGADCWGAAGGLCNNQRPGVARLETSSPAAEPQDASDPRQAQLRLVGA